MFVIERSRVQVSQITIHIFDPLWEFYVSNTSRSLLQSYMMGVYLYKISQITVTNALLLSLVDFIKKKVLIAFSKFCIILEILIILHLDANYEKKGWVVKILKWKNWNIEPV